MIAEKNITTAKTVVEYPITKDRAKRHCHVDKTWRDDDAYIEDLIEAVTQEAENYIDKDISYKSCENKYYDFSGEYIYINEGNFSSTISVVSDASVALTVSETYPYNNYCRLDLSASNSSDPLVVKYYTGFEKEDCPAAMKQAILLRLKDYYDIHRGSMNDFSLYNTMAFERLLDPFKNTNA